MKSEIYAIYKDQEYEITVDMDNNVQVITDDPTKIDEIFEDSNNSGLYSKVVKPSELKDW